MLSVFLDVSIMEGSGTAQHETEILFRNVEAKPESKAGMMSLKKHKTKTKIKINQ